MATSVFGTPITHVTLKKMEEFENYVPTIYDVAIVAFESKNADGRDARAREFIENQRRAFGVDSSLCLIYNATGDTMTIETYRDKNLPIGVCPYPTVIGNGQWGAFLKRGAGAVVYKVRNAVGSYFQVAFMYENRAPGRCYTEIREADYYKPKDSWDVYGTRLDADPTYVSQAHANGLSSFASIGGTTLSPVFEGIITLQNAWSRYRGRAISLMNLTELVDLDIDPAQDNQQEADKNSI